MNKTIQNLLTLEENNHIEMKRMKIKPKDALPRVIGMANGEGGLLILGLEDPKKEKGVKRLYGISEKPENLEELKDLIKNAITPPFDEGIVSEFKIPMINRNGKDDFLYVLGISKSSKVHSTIWGDTYIREGTRTKKLTADQILRLKYSKGEISAENEPVPDINIQDLNTNLINQFRKDVGSFETDLLQFLKKNGLAITYNKKLVLNKAAVLLFADNPNILLKGKYGIKITIYYGKTPSFTGKPNIVGKPITLELPLIQLIYESLKITQQWFKGSPILKGATFTELSKLPEFALQEIITNAIIHRDYSIQNDIQIRIFENKVEVENPGGLPGHITLANIKEERFARNPIILRTLNRFANFPNLDIGEGVKRIYAAMSEANLVSPVYEVTKFKVKVSLLAENKIPYWETVEKYLTEHGKITNKELKKLLGIEDTLKASRLLKKWVEQGQLVSLGESKKTRIYSKPEDLEKFKQIDIFEKLKM